MLGVTLLSLPRQASRPGDPGFHIARGYFLGDRRVKELEIQSNAWRKIFWRS